jgi:hypothetical protein
MQVSEREWVKKKEEKEREEKNPDVVCLMGGFFFTSVRFSHFRPVRGWFVKAPQFEFSTSRQPFFSIIS